MRQVIKDTFFDFTAQREGFTPFMYCDTLNLVTTGVGNLIDNGARNGFDTSPSAMAPAMNLPWKFKGPGWTSKNPVAAGDASQADIREAWTRTKLRQRDDASFIAAGGIAQGGFKYAGFTPLTLDLQGLKDLFNRTLASFDKTLQSDVFDKTGKLVRGPYTAYPNAPADAQLAILSMSWAMGPAFNFPQFKAAFDAEDYRKAGELSFFKGGGGSINARSGRNADNVIMFNNAADVVKAGVDRDRLFFPGSPPPSTGILPSASTGVGAPNKVVTAAIMGTGVAATGWLGWEVFKWYDGRRGKKR